MSITGILDPLDLDIDFSQYKVEQLVRSRSRMLWEFGNSPVLDQLVQAISFEIQDLHDANFNTIEQRSLAKAAGVQLDTIGRIVGQERVLFNASIKVWFGTDANNAEIANPDSIFANAFVEGADLTGDLPADDTQYRALIIAKIFKNHVQGGALPAVLYFIRLLLNIDVSFTKLGNLDLRLLVAAGTPSNIIETILQFVAEERGAESRYLIPLPTGDRITQVGFVPFNDGAIAAFGTDYESGRPDFAKASIVVII